MIDVRRLLAIKAELETAMQGGIDPLMRVVMQRRLDVVCEVIEKAYAEWDKLFEPQELDQLKQRVAELEASNKEMLEELELHKEKCKYLEIYDSCKECTMNESCGLLRVINKAKGVQG